MTPKSLLRHELSVSRWRPDQRRFRAGDRRGRQTVKPASVQRVVFCSGKVYFDLLQARRATNNSRDVALVRIEQLYPFPAQEYEAVLRSIRMRAKSCGARKSRRTRAPGTRSAIACRRGRQARDAVRRPSAGRGSGHRHTKIHDARAARAGRGRAARHATEDVRVRLSVTADRRAAHRRRRHARKEKLMTIEIKVPQLPESVADATLVAWHKSRGRP